MQKVVQYSQRKTKTIDDEEEKKTAPFLTSFNTPP